MRSPLAATVTLVAGAAVLALSACGSSSPGTTTPTPTNAPTSAAANSGSGFCLQAATAVSQLSKVGAGLASTTPGATPSVASFQQLFAAATSAIDALDSTAPSQIASAFHTLRSAYDQANTQVHAATTFDQMSSSLDALNTTAISSADTQVTTYLQTSCGIKHVAVTLTSTEQTRASS